MYTAQNNSINPMIRVRRRDSSYTPQPRIAVTTAPSIVNILRKTYASLLYAYCQLTEKSATKKEDTKQMRNAVGVRIKPESPSPEAQRLIAATKRQFTYLKPQDIVSLTDRISLNDNTCYMLVLDIL